MSAPPRVISPPHQFDIEVTPTSSTLAELILTHISPPGSPASLSSAPSRSRTDSVDESSDEGGNWSSDEHEHSIGTGLERGGVGRRRREEAELVMPSMNLLNPSEFEGNEGVSSSIGQRSRLLLVGRSEEERQTLARLLVGKQGATNDLSQSILSGFASTRSGSNESTAGAIEGVEVIGEDEWMIIYQAVDGGMRGEELADLLERPSRRLERMLNPCFPATVGLESHLNRLGDEEIDMCLFLFSSPPTSTEITLARSISNVLPLLPILLLPPSSKPLKTHVLVQAVSDQLTARGVRWISASAICRKYTDKDRPLFLLPHSLFAGSHSRGSDRRGGVGDSYPSSASGFSSLASSQELFPPPLNSPTRSSTATSANGEDTIDLTRLQDLGSTIVSRDLLKRQKTRSFLDWREVELASRGERMWGVEELPVEWREVALGVEPREAERSLRFSQRVAERREARLEREGQTRFAESEDGEDEEGEGMKESTSTSYAMKDRRASSTYTDPTTPLCRPLPLDAYAFSSLSASNCSTSPPHDGFDSSLHYSYFPIVQSSSVPYFSTNPCSAGVEKVERGVINLDDPFHFPSLLHLVGLNLRMSLLPTTRTEYQGLGLTNVEGGSNTLRWVGTVAIFSAVFLAGMLSGRAGGLVLNLILSERGAVRY